MKKIPEEVLLIIKNKIEYPYMKMESMEDLSDLRDKIIEDIQRYKERKKFVLEHDQYIEKLKSWYEENKGNIETETNK